KMRSGRTSRAMLRHSEPSAAETVSKPCFSSAVLSTCTSVGESSTIMIKAMKTAPSLPRHVTLNRAEQLVLRERLRQVLLGADQSPARAVEQAVLARQHDDGRVLEHAVVLDQRAGLIAVQARHHDVDENDVGPVIRDLRQRVETVDRGEHLAALLREQRLRGAAYRL